MESKAGLLRIGIPTGKGTSGVLKEAVKMAKVMLKEMSSESIQQQWCKYYVQFIDGYTSPSFNGRWGTVLSVNVDNLEYATAIMLSFDYELVKQIESERKKLYYE